MLDKLENIDLTEEINRNSFYPLLKTNSCETNLFVLSEIQKFSKTSDYFKYYTNKNPNTYIKLLNNIETKLSEIFEKKTISASVSEFQEYMTLMSKIIFATHLISKIQEILVEFAQKTKKYYKKKIINFDFQSNFDNFINDYDNMLFNQINTIKNEEQKETCTRCSTETNTTTSCLSQILSKDIFQKNNEYILPQKKTIFKNNAIDDENYLLDIDTPKFKNDENIVNKNENVKEDEDSAYLFVNKKCKTVKVESKLLDEKEPENPQNSNNFRFGSSLSLANLKFTNGDSSKKKIQKVKTVIKKNNNDSNSVKKSEIKNYVPVLNIKKYNSEKNNQDQNIRNKIIRDLLETVGILYKKNEINSEQKVELKKKIISDSDKLINSFYELYDKKNFDKRNLINTLKNYIDK